MSYEIMFWWLLKILDESACSYNILQDISFLCTAFPFRLCLPLYHITFFVILTKNINNSKLL